MPTWRRTSRVFLSVLVGSAARIVPPRSSAGWPWPRASRRRSEDNYARAAVEAYSAIARARVGEARLHDGTPIVARGYAPDSGAMRGRVRHALAVVTVFFLLALVGFF